VGGVVLGHDRCLLYGRRNRRRERARIMIDWESQLMRALLFVPGSDERKLKKVGTFGADVIVIDLEDAVADEEKTAARATTRAAIPTYGDGQVVTVRINGIETGRVEEDIAAVVCSGLDAILVPKIEDAETLQTVDALLTAAEREQGLERGSVRVLAIVETPRGIVRCDEILERAPARTVTSIFGLGDFSVALGVELTADQAELAYARGRVVVATRAAGMVPPIDGPTLDLTDEDGLVRDCRRARSLGFQGKVCVYPPQVVPIQRSFSELTEDEVAATRRLVEVFEEAESRGVASIRIDGRFVDYPIYHLARRKLDRWQSFEATAGETR
jgi:citrate lyase subunit beta / citryl-CoA lyase